MDVRIHACTCDSCRTTCKHDMPLFRDVCVSRASELVTATRTYAQEVHEEPGPSCAQWGGDELEYGQPAIRIQSLGWTINEVTLVDVDDSTPIPLHVWCFCGVTCSECGGEWHPCTETERQPGGAWICRSCFRSRHGWLQDDTSSEEDSCDDDDDTAQDHDAVSCEP